jgi:hypothetical protein
MENLALGKLKMLIEQTESDQEMADASGEDYPDEASILLVSIREIYRELLEGNANE